jgi:hypothetical protein
MQLLSLRQLPNCVEEDAMTTRKSSSARKYSPAASKDVEREMKAMKQGNCAATAGKK